MTDEAALSTLNGTLTWRRPGKNSAPVPEIEYRTARGKLTKTSVPPGQLAPTVAEPANAPVAVVLELDGKGRPQRVRRPGETWSVAPRSAAIAPPPHRQPQGIPRHSPKQGFAHRDQAPAVERPRSGNPFHNPYAFVPAPARDQLKGDLADARVCGLPAHDRFQPGLVSGTIRVKLTTRTPLLLPDPARAVQHPEAQGEHFSYPVRLGPDGKPRLHPASVRGMLRSAYEIVTNSRFSVLGPNHRDRQGYRGIAANEALSLVPAMLVEVGGVRKIRLMTGITRDPDPRPRFDGRSWRVPDGMMYAAWLHFYKRQPGRPVDVWYETDGGEPQHGDYVKCWVSERGRGIFKYLKVERIVRSDRPLPPRRDPKWREIEGFVCRTNPNIERKFSERVFFVDPGRRPYELPLTEALSTHWQAVIQDYRAIHKKDLDQRRRDHCRPDDYLGHEPGKTAWSRHVYEPSAVKLAPDPPANALCYVRFDKVGTAIGLYPVMISRDVYPLPSIDLLDRSLRPAAGLAELSPADRVFGWVHRGEGGTGDRAENQGRAYKGKLRIGPVRCDSPPERAISQWPEGKDLPLGILGEPKLTNTRMRLAGKDGGRLTMPAKRDAGFTQANRHQGRYVVPHQWRLTDDYFACPWDDRTASPDHLGQAQEYRRPLGTRDNQNRTLEGWVEPGCAFRFDLQVSNLTRVELGALLWLLRLNDGLSEPGYFHRLGGGKAFGFGSATLEVAGEPQLAAGEAWRDHYAAAFGSVRPQFLTPDQLEKAVAEFREAVVESYGTETGAAFDAVPFIAGFRMAAQGRPGEFPTHYPRGSAGQDPKGENYQWWVGNENRENGPPQATAPLPDATPLHLLSGHRSR